jgi:hypothetical protein
MPSSSRFALVAILAVMAAIAAVPASATIISSSASLSSCTNAFGQTVNGCTDTIYYSTDAASDTTPFISGNVAGQNPINADFVTAFNGWNAANGNTWTLVNGGNLNLTLTLSIGATLSTSSAGISPIVVNISNYTQGANDPNLNQLAWTQGLFTNYTPTSGLTFTPNITLDTYSLSKNSSGSGGAFQTACTPIPGAPNANNNTTPSNIGAVQGGKAYCDPLYPFQYGSSDNGGQVSSVTLGTDFFYDAPQGAWPTSAFRGIALLSTVTYDTNSQGVVTGDILTVYQGVNYGFSLSSTPGAQTTTVPDIASTQLAEDVPEPATAGIVAIGLAVSIFGRIRRARRGG